MNKMKKSKLIRITALVLSLMLIIGTVAGCNKKETATNDDGNVTLKWVMSANGEMKDCERVWAEFNKQLQNYMPGTTIEFELIPYSDFAEKWNLMSASREKVDLVWVGWMLNLDEEVRKGSFMPLDDLLKYAPEMTAEIPANVLDLCRVKGELYAIPCYQMMTGLPYGYKVPKDLADEYGLDHEKIAELFANDKRPSKEDFKPFEEWLERLKQAGKLGKGVSKKFLDYIMGYMKGNGPMRAQVAANAYVDISNDDLKVYDFITHKNNMDYYDLVTEWFNKGYIRKDILSLTDITLDEGKKDGYVLWADSCFKGASETDSKKYGMEVISTPIFDKFTVSHQRPSTNTAIAKTSENPEKAMEFLNLMNSTKGKDLFNLLVYGLEGEHYKKIDDTKIEWLLESAPGTSSDMAYGFSAWALGNTFNAYTTQYDVDGWNEYILNEVNANAYVSPLAGFSLDRQPIKLELAQYDAIFSEYLYLDLGATKNYKELLEERNEKIKKAGSDKILKEVQRQIDEWKKTK